MATQMPNFIARLARPFTSSTRMAISSDTSPVPANAATATIAAGCFWGVEHAFRRAFSPSAGLYSARVGYIGGDLKNPSYSKVCSGRTGHAEALKITYDPEKISYSQVLEFFYRMHDPTTLDSQGPDHGSQYRSAIFYHDAEQERVAREVTKKVNEQWWKGGIVTQIIPAGEWYDAETYHQEYLEEGKNPGGYQCPSHFVRKFPALS